MAVILRLDDVAAQQVEGLIEALPDRRVRRHPPCIRLATYDDTVEVAGLGTTLANATETWKKLSISLVGIGVYPGEPSSLWLAPVPIGKLLRWHVAVDEALFPGVGRHCHELGVWTPYISLGQTAFPAEAVEVLTSLWREPIEATLDRIELVRLNPWEVVSSRVLRD